MSGPSGGEVFATGGNDGEAVTIHDVTMEPISVV